MTNARRSLLRASQEMVKGIRLPHVLICYNSCMQLYRFSPIKTDEDIQASLKYIQQELRRLSALVMDEVLPINTLKIFAHYDEEYDYLKKWIDRIGDVDDASSETSYYVAPKTTIKINEDPIEFVGIRKPDPYRSHVGCGDYVVPNFEELKDKYLGSSPYIRQVPHAKYEMLELFHPDIDVLGYIVKEY